MKFFLEELKTKAAKLKLEVFALYIAYQDSRTPWHAKAFTAIVIAYAFSPIDLIPDFIPILGYLDDLILIPLGIRLAIKLIPIDVMKESREKAKELARESKPVSRAGAFLVILVWIFVISVLAIKLFT